MLRLYGTLTLPPFPLLPLNSRWSLFSCIFAELRTRVALFNANIEATQLEAIFKLLGCPQGALLDKLRELPDWEKLGFKNFHYSNRLPSKLSGHFDPVALSLLEGLLDLHPDKRLTAAVALNHEYFTATRVMSPDE